MDSLNLLNCPKSDTNITHRKHSLLSEVTIIRLDLIVM